MSHSTSSDSTKNGFKTGIYKVTKGEYIDAAIFLMEITQPEESEFTYFTVYNPDSSENHEIPMDEWQVIADEDGLTWASEIPDNIKDQYLLGSMSQMEGL
ncbi:MAG: hypothetical protein ISEC1_P1926 [Thiomicrorhabdus sp.]|nr:MAG: hypothetical protein ISEC1_P1926 [Thiomicrorhabdus sp.]